MKKAISVEQLLMKKFKDMKFEGKWKQSFGNPEFSGIWIVWGASGNGKTNFCMQLAKYLTNFGDVAYNTLEEGARKSMQRVIALHDMKTVSKRFKILDAEGLKAIEERLSHRNSPDIVIIDSFQFFGLTQAAYIEFKNKWKNKLFIFISHADGNHPEGRVAKFVRYDADIKIHVASYQANIISRYGGGKPFIIWEEEHRKIFG